MRDLAALAEQIRTVREAEKHFTRLWHVEQVLVGPQVLDRLAQDMDEIWALADEVLSCHEPAGNAGKTGKSYLRPHGRSMNDQGGPADVQ
jgi:hypothetical protein